MGVTLELKAAAVEHHPIASDAEPAPVEVAGEAQDGDAGRDQPVEVGLPEEAAVGSLAERVGADQGRSSISGTDRVAHASDAARARATLG